VWEQKKQAYFDRTQQHRQQQQQQHQPYQQQQQQQQYSYHHQQEPIHAPNTMNKYPQPLVAANSSSSSNIGSAGLGLQHNQQILPSRAGRGGQEGWGPFGVKTNRGGGGDPFRDTQGRIATNIRQGANALKEGQREIPGLLNNVSKDEYRAMLEHQVEEERKKKEVQKAELEKTLWWEKAERREKVAGGAESSQSPFQQQQQQQQQHLPPVHSPSHQQQYHPQEMPSVYYPNQQQQRQQQQIPPQQFSSPGRSHQGSGDRSGDSAGHAQQRLDAMEVLVLENSELRRENGELRRVLMQYQQRFGGL
jgi:hypothetical protein